MLLSNLKKWMLETIILAIHGLEHWVLSLLEIHISVLKFIKIPFAQRIDYYCILALITSGLYRNVKLPGISEALFLWKKFHMTILCFNQIFWVSFNCLSISICSIHIFVSVFMRSLSEYLFFWYTCSNKQNSDLNFFSFL